MYFSILNPKLGFWINMSFIIERIIELLGFVLTLYKIKIIAVRFNRRVHYFICSLFMLYYVFLSDNVCKNCYINFCFYYLINIESWLKLEEPLYIYSIVKN